MDKKVKKEKEKEKHEVLCSNTGPSMILNQSISTGM
jgi:hypothetical protein